MELFKFYSLDECFDLKNVKRKLEQLEDDGKIEYSIEGDILKIKDIDLDELEITNLTGLLDNNDIFPYPDYDEESGDDFDGDDFYDDVDNN